MKYPAANRSPAPSIITRLTVLLYTSPNYVDSAGVIDFCEFWTQMAVNSVQGRRRTPASRRNLTGFPASAQRTRDSRSRENVKQALLHSVWTILAQLRDRENVNMRLRSVIAGLNVQLYEVKKLMEKPAHQLDRLGS
ncbi:hypothetical protein PENSTE_c031G10026 [Penicillium steckii]|uniref:Uncharacterized protein n=1 Tax=Penicillium steckii TaxID=303698 RepID=A0A1V6SMQ2_9EURO|nr:hypothetical protein PENSTE_c031G10026 [Penicillium steckii]